MIFNPVAAGGGGVKKVTFNPEGTSIDPSDNYVFTFSGLTKANIKSGCIAAVVAGFWYGMLFISKSGETFFTQYGGHNFRIEQPYDPSSGTFVMKSDTLYSGGIGLIIVLE